MIKCSVEDCKVKTICLNEGVTGQLTWICDFYLNKPNIVELRVVILAFNDYDLMIVKTDYRREKIYS